MQAIRSELSQIFSRDDSADREAPAAAPDGDAPTLLDKVPGGASARRWLQDAAARGARRLRASDHTYARHAWLTALAVYHLSVAAGAVALHGAIPCVASDDTARARSAKASELLQQLAPWDDGQAESEDDENSEDEGGEQQQSGDEDDQYIPDIVRS